MCTKTERWGAKAERSSFSFEGDNLLDHTADVKLWKHTVWKDSNGRIHDEIWDPKTPNNKGDKQKSLRLKFAGKDHAYHRVVAFLYSNDGDLSWDEFNEEDDEGRAKYEVNHIDEDHSNNVRRNLEILTAGEHRELDGR